MANEQDRQHLESSLPPELLILLDAFRNEMDAKIGGLKLWGALALLGGGTLGGIVSKFLAPTQTSHVGAALRHLFF